MCLLVFSTSQIGPQYTVPLRWVFLQLHRYSAKCLSGLLHCFCYSLPVMGDAKSFKSDACIYIGDFTTSTIGFFRSLVLLEKSVASSVQH